GVVSINEYDNARAQADEARAQYNEKKAQLDEFVAGPRIEKIKQEEANLAAAEARIRIIEDRIERAALRAPFDGFVVKKETEIGQWLEKGDPGITLIAANPIKVEVHLPQFHYDRVTPGTPGTVILEGRNSFEKDQVFEGKVIEKIQS
ncbi:MAG: HlyD family efflux transporter periplasmic adaptor subunit, partial [Nitrospinaceae bacterium]|nr:HlyD family efflux transporter periplasmic adaptor subunit [Nitrospinaceae bacterium]NIR57028.1 HlyD family efflux transporter periplasmic adaptor subunit [Nitrospinaceae bacterium]NIS87481.1 HlyD family efflux transporter periplasmic adaptor subunit [Nitrospinaceae bacterium]NIT84335.1 HlyD family efflux transporter periplasmic adaptor subunit [Nitrospinaceae bacterium]NIU46524.1 HlyD family efflux transporter periplasmic adaptor subunit [Nitrospinaceae bacterium]